MADKLMTKLNPLIKSPNPLDLEENLFLPEDDDSLPRKAQLEQLRRKPKRALCFIKRWLMEG
jgi:hypothetical protein